jgi:hypothetical protein
MCPRTMFPEFVNPALDMPIEFLRRLNLGPGLEKIYLIGANGEPTQHPRFLEFVAELKKRTQAQIYINTHASFKPAWWWAELSEILSSRDHLVFSIDGLKDTNHLYRVNSRWNQIEEAVKSSVGKVNTTWKFIVFKHNEHQIVDAVRQAKDWGVKYFSLKRSDRWNEPYWPDGAEKDWMSQLRPSAAFVTKDYKDVEGPYSIQRKFNSFLNVELARIDVEEFALNWKVRFGQD